MPKTTPRDFFLQLGVLAGLYVSAVSLLTLLFHIINIVFPDVLEGIYDYYDPYSSGLRIAIAALIVVFPLYLFLASVLNRLYQEDPSRRELALRKWVSHLTIFIAGATLVIALVTLINSFLGGSTTVRFALKILSVLVVAGLAFGYYLYDLRQEMPNSRVNKTLGLLSVLAVLAAMVGGFSLLGSPFTQRELRLDRQKIMDLQNIQWQVIEHWRVNEELPASLDSIQGFKTGGINLSKDPQTGMSYEYKKTGNLSFQLCAEFNQTTPEPRGRAAVTLPTMSISRSGALDNWQHEAGRTCFDRTIDPKTYPPYELPKPQVLVD